MAIYTNINLTAAGRALLDSRIFGDADPLTVTAIALGDGQLAPGETEASRTALVNLVKMLALEDIEQADGTLTLHARLASDTLDTDFMQREIGIYAGETLLAYANAGDNYDAIPATGKATAIVKTITARLSIGSAQVVFETLPTDDLVTFAAMEARIRETVPAVARAAVDEMYNEGIIRDGLDAFETWQARENRPDATWDDYMADIKGDPGEQGAPGVPGERGERGEQGEPGQDADPAEVAEALALRYGDIVDLEGPNASTNANADYIQLGEAYVQAGCYVTRLGWRCASVFNDSSCTSPVYLGIWEQSESGDDWLPLGVSINTQEQAVWEDVIWRFEPGAVKLSGRPIRCCLMERQDDGWREDLIISLRVSNGAHADTQVSVNGTPQQLVPKYFLKGALMSDVVKDWLDGLKGERGEKGDKGDTGLPGERGEPGPKGEPGERGEQGLQGEPGPKGDKGEPGEQGQKGDKGDQGAQGPKGDPGEPGRDGVDGAPGQDGESAYQVAVRNGFVGDEEAWLASLKGEKGEPGKDGGGGVDLAEALRVESVYGPEGEEEVIEWPARVISVAVLSAKKWVKGRRLLSVAMAASVSLPEAISYLLCEFIKGDSRTGESLGRCQSVRCVVVDAKVGDGVSRWFFDGVEVPEGCDYLRFSFQPAAQGVCVRAVPYECEAGESLGWMYPAYTSYDKFPARMALVWGGDVIGGVVSATLQEVVPADMRPVSSGAVADAIEAAGKRRDGGLLVVAEDMEVSVDNIGNAAVCDGATLTVRGADFSNAYTGVMMANKGATVQVYNNAGVVFLNDAAMSYEPSTDIKQCRNRGVMFAFGSECKINESTFFNDGLLVADKRLDLSKIQNDGIILKIGGGTIGDELILYSLDLSGNVYLQEGCNVVDVDGYYVVKNGKFVGGSGEKALGY